MKPVYLYSFDRFTETKSLVEGTYGFLIIKQSEFVFTFDVVEDKTVILQSSVTSELNYNISTRENQVMWIEQINE